MLITVIILIAINVGLVLALRNLLVKVEKYEDITLSQAKYSANNGIFIRQPRRFYLPVRL